MTLSGKLAALLGVTVGMAVGPSPVTAQICTADRTIVSPGCSAGPYRVTINAHAAGSGTKVYAIEDRPPPGWDVTNVSAAGVFDPVRGRVRWGLFSDGTDRTHTYDLTGPVAGAIACFGNGIISCDGVNQRISGDRCADGHDCQPDGIFDVCQLEGNDNNCDDVPDDCESRYMSTARSLLVVDNGTRTVNEYDGGSGALRRVFASATPACNLQEPSGIAVSADDAFLYVADRSSRKVFRYDYETGGNCGLFVDTPALIDRPQAIAVASDSTVFVGAGSNVRRFSKLGAPLGTWPACIAIADVDIGANGTVFVIGRDQVCEYESDSGTPLDAWELHGAQFKGGAFGPDGRLYIANQHQNNLIRLDVVTGDFTPVPGAETLDQPFDVALDPCAARLVIADSATVEQYDLASGTLLDPLITPIGAGSLAFSPAVLKGACCSVPQCSVVSEPECVARGGELRTPGSICPPLVPANWDGDCDIDLVDYATIGPCFRGPAQRYQISPCLRFDLDNDGDVDLKDYRSFLGDFLPDEP